jgi:hypothetical protein
MYVRLRRYAPPGRPMPPTVGAWAGLPKSRRVERDTTCEGRRQSVLSVYTTVSGVVPEVGGTPSTSTHFKYYRGEHILSDAKSALRENAKMQTRADEPLKVRLRRAIFTCLFYLGTRKGTTRTRARRALVKLSILDPRTCTVVSRQWALVSTSSSASDVGSSSLPSGTCEDLFGKSRSNCVAASACSSSCACAHDVVKVHLENR